jgi:phosphorylase superfamily
MPHCDTDGWLTTTTPSLLPYAPSSIPRRRGYTVSHPTQGGKYTAEGIPIPQEAIETMEGAAFAYAMAELHTPSLAIRTISNYCAPMASAQWDIHTAQNGVQKAITQSLQIIASYHNEQKGQQ